MGKAQNRAERKLAFVKAHMRVGDEWAEIRIGNVSSTGLMAKCEHPPEVGRHVELRRRGTTILGEVVWATQNRFGLSSLAEIDHTALLARSELQPDRRSIARGDAGDRRLASRWWSWWRGSA